MMSSTDPATRSDLEREIRSLRSDLKHELSMRTSDLMMGAFVLVNVIAVWVMVIVAIAADAKGGR